MQHRGPAWILAALLATLAPTGCAVEVDRVGLLCNEAEPCEPGLSCIDGRCEFARTLAIEDNLPPGRRGQTYRGDVTITGGEPPYTLEVTSFSGGAFVLEADGTQIFSTETLAEGVYDVGLRVSDSAIPVERTEITATLEVRGLPVVDSSDQIDAGDPLPEGSRTFVGNSIQLEDGRWATALLRLSQDDANTITPEVAVLLGDTESNALLPVIDPELPPAQPNVTRDVPLGMPKVHEYNGRLWVTYAAQNDDSSHSFGITRMDYDGQAQRHAAYDLNSGTVYGGGLVIIDGKVFAAAMSVSITADIVVARLDEASMAVEERRAQSFTGVRNEERTGLEIVEIAGEPWVFAASKLGAYAGRLDKENLERIDNNGLEREVDNYFDVQVEVVGNTIIHAWARGTGVASIDLYRTAVGSLASPGQPVSLANYGVSTEAARYGSFEMTISGAEIMFLAVDATDNALVGALGSLDGSTFEPLTFDTGSVPGMRATPSVVRRSDSRYQLLWSEETDATTRERRLFRALTRDP